MIKCCKCHREATFESPKPFCDLHWEWWFTFGHEVFMSSKKLYRLRYNDLKRMWGRGGGRSGPRLNGKKRPVGWRKMVKELK